MAIRQPGDSTENAQRSPFTLSPSVRIGLLTLGIAAATLAVSIASNAQPADMTATAFVVVSGVACLLGFIGRLPRGFQAFGMSADFDDHVAIDILSVLRDEVDDDTYRKIEEILLQERSAAQKAEIDERILAKSEDPRGADSSTQERSATDHPGPALSVDSWIQSLSDENGEVRTDYQVLGVNPGRPPRVDFAVAVGGIHVAVEHLRTWSPSNLDLASRRMRRVLASPEFERAVVLVEPRALAAVNAWFGRELGDDRLIVRTLSDDPSKVRADLLPTRSEH